MASGDQRQGKEPAAAAAEDKFPEGMRVLVVDDDPVWLGILETQLRICEYNPTMVSDARTALKMLREGGEEQFDLVITDVYMPDMDGFMLLELIGLEMDLPVIMLSASGEKETVEKGITHGACDYLVKPVSIKELKNIWQHVVRKNLDAVNHISSDNNDVDERVQPGIAECAQGGAKSKKYSKKKKNDGDGSDEYKETTGVANRKKPRVSWTGELHGRFLEVINRLGVDRAVPKKILEMMNVANLSRESVASHLQKYRRYLKRFTESWPPGKEYEKRSSWHNNMNHQASSSHHREHQRGQSSVVAIWGSNSMSAVPSVLGPHGLSIQPRNSPANLFANKSYHTMLDTFPSVHSDKPYVNMLREKLLEASGVVPSSHPSNSFTSMPIGGMLEHADLFPVQPQELVNQFSGQTNGAPYAAGMHRDAQLPCLVGNSSNPWKDVVSSSFTDHMYETPIIQSPHVNIPEMNQLTSFATSPSQMSIFQNEEQHQVVGNINNNTLMADFSERVASFNIARNTTPNEIASDNFSQVTPIVNGGSIGSPSPNLQVANYVVPTNVLNGGSIRSAIPGLETCGFVAPTQMLNGMDASGIVPMQEGPVDQEALDDEANYNNPFLLENIFASMLNQDFNEDDAFFVGEC